MPKRVEINDLKAALDQIKSGLRDVCPVIYAHYDFLMKAGFDREQAFVLTRDYHNTLIQPSQFPDFEEGSPDEFPFTD